MCIKRKGMRVDNILRNMTVVGRTLSQRATNKERRENKTTKNIPAYLFEVVNTDEVLLHKTFKLRRFF